MDNICIEEVLEVAALRRSGLVVIAPEPDEFDGSHLGAMARINGFAESEDFELFARSALHTAYLSPAPLSHVEMLARICRVPNKVYGECHSMIPFWRAISSGWVDEQHDYCVDRIASYIEEAPKYTTNPKFCLQCASAEQVLKGRSYWHREFQIPGIVKCTKHQAMVFDMRGLGSFCSAPMTCVEDLKWCSLIALEDFCGHPVYQTYAGVCGAFSETRRPYVGRAVSELLAQRCKAQHIRKSTSKDPRKAHYKTISEVAFETVPLKWLRMLDELITPGQKIIELENAAWGTGRTRTDFYALACALLFSSADESLDLIRGVSNCFGQHRDQPLSFQLQMTRQWISRKVHGQCNRSKQAVAFD